MCSSLAGVFRSASTIAFNHSACNGRDTTSIYSTPCRLYGYCTAKQIKRNQIKSKGRSQVPWTGPALPRSPSSAVWPSPPPALQWWPAHANINPTVGKRVYSGFRTYFAPSTERVGCWDANHISNHVLRVSVWQTGARTDCSLLANGEDRL